MEKKNSFLRVGHLSILCGILTILLCAPAYSAVLTVDSEDILDVGTGKQMEEILSSEWWWVDVYGTLNMYPGAYIEPVVYTYSGSTVNIYAGEIGAGYFIMVFDGATVTVYGTNFHVGDTYYDTPTSVPIPDGILEGTYGDESPIYLWIVSAMPINLAAPGEEPPANQPPVPDAGPDVTVFSKDIASTVIDGTAQDDDAGDSLQYRWLEGAVEFTSWMPVGANGEAPLDLGTILPEYLDVGTHTLTLQVTDGKDTGSNDMVLTIKIATITIDIKPGSYPNSINLGSHGVVPVAILSTAELDATTLNPENIFLAGSGVAVRGKGNKYLASQEDVNGDGLTDLVVKVETENLDPGTFQNGSAILTIHETSDPNSPILFQGSDEITIVPPE